ncbi:hypothetical protein GGR39_003132 [Novosphingobium fluoreni]|uniref:Uncharacterized protein n=1 Tax=Novosphingobium fluoreni TaxID=1391222 RepID=A0A7W6C6I1_9SPHN|nr:DUF6118 family protein [Novosphingobium fluoreni]MBB3941455.1 hypothetical protein [Novosphingobium fluoreni]
MTEPDPPAELDATEAFEAMNRRLAGMSAAIDGFAMRFDDLQERDYSKDLAQIEERIERLGEGINILSRRPAMALTPERIAGQIDEAANTARKAEQATWGQARQQLSVEVNSIREVVYSAREAAKQDRWLLVCMGIGIVVGAMLMFVVPRVALDVVPDSWLWREQTAVQAMNREGWSAGERLMQIYDPTRWEGVALFLQLPEKERAKFSDCLQRGYDNAKGITCRIRSDVAKAR